MDSNLLLAGSALCYLPLIQSMARQQIEFFHQHLQMCAYVCSKKYKQTHTYIHVYVYGVFIYACECLCVMCISKNVQTILLGVFSSITHSSYLVFPQRREAKGTFFNASSSHSLSLWLSSAVTSVLLTFHPE